MNVLFLTMSRVSDILSRGIYTDLMRKFHNEGHEVYVVSPRERRYGEKTQLYDSEGVHILGVRTMNLQKTNVVEKGIGQILVETQYKRAICKSLKKISFDLILYATPPITFPKVISYLKRRNPEVRTYLLLKDIFPQNALDVGLMSRKGVNGLLYRFFRKKEKKLYDISDYIGCMSPANVYYIIKHNPEVDQTKVEVAPNSIELTPLGVTNKNLVRVKFGLPTDKPIFIYGGNLGKPQGIPFLIKCLEANSFRDDCFFLVVGSGTELHRLKQWVAQTRPKSVNVMNGLPKSEYDELVRACDVGLIFLDYRFTIPNYPSRLLSYLENKMPVLCATDIISDIGKIAEENGYGYWCESNSIEAFTKCVDKILLSDIVKMGEKGYEFLYNNYRVDLTYNIIMRHFV